RDDLVTGVQTCALPISVNMDCTLIVPPNPLTAQGLATPYQLTATDRDQGPCKESNPKQAVFVQGAVIDPATGHIAIYNPLVIDRSEERRVGKECRARWS